MYSLLLPQVRVILGLMQFIFLQLRRLAAFYINWGHWHDTVLLILHASRVIYYMSRTMLHAILCCFCSLPKFLRKSFKIFSVHMVIFVLQNETSNWGRGFIGFSLLHIDLQWAREWFNHFWLCFCRLCCSESLGWFHKRWCILCSFGGFADASTTL